MIVRVPHASVSTLWTTIVTRWDSVVTLCLANYHAKILEIAQGLGIVPTMPLRGRLVVTTLLSTAFRTIRPVVQAVTP